MLVEVYYVKQYIKVTSVALGRVKNRDYQELHALKNQ